MEINLKKKYIYTIIGLLVLLIGIFIVNAAVDVDKTKAWHSANDVLVSVGDFEGSLQQAIDGGHFIGLPKSTQSYTTEIPDPGHTADKIWVSVDGTETTLQEAISTIGLCGSSSHSYTGSINPGHFASEIEVTGGNRFQELIDSGEFCCVPETSCPTSLGCECGTCDDGCGGTLNCGTCGSGYTCSSGTCVMIGECIPGQTRTKDCDTLDTVCTDYYDVTDTCSSTGYWTNPPCDSYTYMSKGTSCSISGCSGYTACNGAGNCVCVSGALGCHSSASSSITLSYSYSNSLSSQVSIFRGSAKLITYTGSAGSGTYATGGLSESTSYTFYLRDGTTTSSPLLAQISCSTITAPADQEEPDFSDLPDRVVDGGGDGGGKVICTELYSTGILDEETYKMDVKYASEHFSKEAIRGYQAWAIPVVKFMRKSEEAERTAISLVNSFMEEIAYRSGKRETGNEVGKLFLDEGVPLFERIGKYIDEPDWKSLFNQNWLSGILKNSDFLLYYIFDYKSLLQKEDKYDEIVENYFTEQKVREMFYDAERRGGNSQLAFAKALVENLEDAVEDIESLIESA